MKHNPPDDVARQFQREGWTVGEPPWDGRLYTVRVLRTTYWSGVWHRLDELVPERRRIPKVAWYVLAVGAWFVLAWILK